LQERAVAVSWVTTSIEEENLVEDWLGKEVEPGCLIMRPDAAIKCPVSPEIVIPPEWLENFPSGRTIFEYIVSLIPRNDWKRSIDELLIKRRELEFQIFETVERNDVLPRIKDGFKSVEEFIKYAHSVSNRRKSRTGTSLELNLESIFRDERIAFESQVITENHKKPDFVFPSGKAYHDEEYPFAKLHMLASKTCCKDRWRQVLNEANKIKTKHLFTLQQGVTSHQLQEMKDHNVELVVTAPSLRTFHSEWRDSLISLEKFVNYIRTQQASVHGIEKWTN
jgi:hypothetical protein